MDQESTAITILCANIALNEKTMPLTTSEWHKFTAFLGKRDLTPASVLIMNYNEILDLFNGAKEKASRISVLVQRSGSFSFAIEKLRSRGIQIATINGREYPQKLKLALKEKAPPLFYYAGNPVLASFKSVGFVGSRNISPTDKSFTEQTVLNVINKGYGIISGGARGVDTVSSAITENSDAYSVEFLSDSLESRMKKPEIIRRILAEKLLLFSAAKPSAGFDVGMAMSRNKYIYANSYGTVVVKSDFAKGGTWSGAKENLLHRWSNTFCWNNPSYKGNQELIKLGAIPIEDNWTADLESYPNDPPQIPKEMPAPDQLSFL